MACVSDCTASYFVLLRGTAFLQKLPDGQLQVSRTLQYYPLRVLLALPSRDGRGRVSCCVASGSLPNLLFLICQLAGHACAPPAQHFL